MIQRWPTLSSGGQRASWPTGWLAGRSARARHPRAAVPSERAGGARAKNDPRASALCSLAELLLLLLLRPQLLLLLLLLANLHFCSCCAKRAQFASFCLRAQTFRQGCSKLWPKISLASRRNAATLAPLASILPNQREQTPTGTSSSSKLGKSIKFSPRPAN